MSGAMSVHSTKPSIRLVSDVASFTEPDVDNDRLTCMKRVSLLLKDPLSRYDDISRT